jgi:predicted anti-sigma-YlaC factor YlaD
MRCSKAQRWVSQGLDGMLSPEREARLDQHLAACEACRAYAAEVENLGLDLLNVPEPAPDFTMRVVGRLADAPVLRPSFLRRPAVFRPIAAGMGVAAALGGFLVGSLLWPGRESGTVVQNGAVELVAVKAFDPLAEDPAEAVSLTIRPDGEE